MKIPQNLRENVILAPYTTFKIGGPALFFIEARTEQEVIEGLEWAKTKHYPTFILGGGSNLLISDAGFPGLVIKNEISFIKGPDGTIIEAGAGTFFGSVIMAAVNAGLEGLEWGTGIPGTLGGAICGNAGAFGHSTGETVEEVRFLNGDKIKADTCGNHHCRFDYRDSVFKHKNLTILSAKLKLHKQNPEVLQEAIREILKKRPMSPPFPSAGSVFKNIEFKSLPAEIRKKIPPERVKGGKIPTGYLIEQIGLLGKQIGGAKIWENHGNFIVNAGTATARDVIALVEMARNLVKEAFGVILEEEIRHVGF